MKNRFVVLASVLFSLGVLLFFVNKALANTVYDSTSMPMTIIVNSTHDAVNVNPGNGICETEPGNSVCTLRAAIQEANATAGQNTIILPAGVYTLTIAGEDENDSETGDLDILDSLIIQGDQADTTIIDGNALDRVFDVRFTDAHFSNLTIQNGLVNDTSIFLVGGGAIRATYGSQVTLDHVVLRNNVAINSNQGGAIMMLGDAAVSITNSVIYGNSAAGSGGAIANNMTGEQFATTLYVENTVFADNTGANGGAISFSGAYHDSVTLQNVIFDNNQATNQGGALHFSGANTLLLAENTNFYQNIANSVGGAIYATGLTQTISITNAQFVANQAINSSGGGLSLYNADSVVTGINAQITNSQFISNTANGWGGGLRISGAATNVQGTNLEFAHNTANHGGGLSTSGSQNSIILYEPNFENNTVSEQGGAIRSYGISTTVAINSGIFQNNLANLGGAISSYGSGPFGNIGVTIDLSRTVFYENTAGSGGALFQNVGTAVDIAQSAFISNTAILNGGALHTFGDGSGANAGLVLSNIINSTFSHNQANSHGGAIYGFGMNNSIFLKNVTIAYNIADSNHDGTGDGGGLAVDNGASISLENSLIANNIDNGNESPDCVTQIATGGGVVTSWENNLIGKIDGCDNFNTPDFNDGDLIGTIDEPIDPVLYALTGTLPHHPLGVGSPAIDSGSDLPPHPSVGHAGCSPVDQLGTTRPVDGNGDGTAICDIGAIEAPERISVTVDETNGTTLVYTTTQNSSVTIVIPAGAVTQTTTFVYTPISTVTSPAEYSFGGYAFELAAYQYGEMIEDFVFNNPISVTVNYLDEDVVNLTEAELILMYSADETWFDAACGPYQRNVAANYLTVPICHLTLFGLFGPASVHTVYLPVVTYNYPVTLETINLINPIDGSQLDTLIPVLTFETGNVPPNTFGCIAFSTEPNPQCLSGFILESNTVQERVIWFNLQPDTIYYWRVGAGQSLNPETIEWSDEWSFRTSPVGGLILPPPALVSPVDHSTVSSDTITLHWEPVSGAIEYSISIRDRDENRYYGVNVPAPETTVGPDDLAWIFNVANGSNFEWSVRVRNDYAWSNYSTSWNFVLASPDENNVTLNQQLNIIYEKLNNPYFMTCSSWIKISGIFLCTPVR